MLARLTLLITELGTEAVKQQQRHVLLWQLAGAVRVFSHPISYLIQQEYKFNTNKTEPHTLFISGQSVHLV